MSGRYSWAWRRTAAGHGACLAWGSSPSGPGLGARQRPPAPATPTCPDVQEAGTLCAPLGAAGGAALTRKGRHDQDGAKLTVAPPQRGDGLRAVGNGGKATPGLLRAPGTLSVVQVSVG